MFQFCNLYSGSTGNCSLIKSESTKILIDCGETVKKISSTLSDLSIEPDKLDAIVVTHEHSDHTKSIGSLSAKYNIPVYANQGTWDNMPSQTSRINEENKRIFKTNDNFEIGDLKLHSFSIPHDAAEPCGFNIFHDNKKISVATDLGHITKEIYKRLEDSQFVLLEANYDPEILKYSRYPYILKKRITGPNGHLSNQESGNLLSLLAKSGLNQIMLGHLSKENNFPELAYKTVVDTLINQNLNQNAISLHVASRFGPSPKIEIA